MTSIVTATGLYDPIERIFDYSRGTVRQKTIRLFHTTGELLDDVQHRPAHLLHLVAVRPLSTAIQLSSLIRREIWRSWDVQELGISTGFLIEDIGQ